MRAQAVTALLAAGDRDRALTPIVARLTDPARVVRARAAEALLALGVVEFARRRRRGARPRAGRLCARARPVSRRRRPITRRSAGSRPNDIASDPAIAALDTAIRLDPKAARPLVIKGVIAAREGRFKEASELWRKAKALEPGYPNIDRLIEEAEKRK